MLHRTCRLMIYHMLPEPMNKLLAKMHQRGMDLTEKLCGDLQGKASGGFADVYLGFLEDGTAVAVKRARFWHDHPFGRQELCKVSSYLHPSHRF